MIAIAENEIAERTRSLARTVHKIRAGICPRCGVLGPVSDFAHDDRHECPACRFFITKEEAAIADPEPRMSKAEDLDLFFVFRATLRSRSVAPHSHFWTE